MASELRISSLGVRGLRKKLKKNPTFKQLRDLKTDVACLHVTKEIIDGVEKEWKGEVIYKEETARSNGLMILLNHQIHSENIEVVKQL